eukprot:TRINITY_DN9369_c0_g4_i3.p1 TRINITY_DN9369_c0_g4~~TRINITY_DN9369_c0_g4_i3.p1  ORF type:complete len:711 (-),score=144.55 TRINITY_DN9369_c0_g4_i3:425-2314(-)
MPCGLAATPLSSCAAAAFGAGGASGMTACGCGMPCHMPCGGALPCGMLPCAGALPTGCGLSCGPGGDIGMGMACTGSSCSGEVGCGCSCSWGSSCGSGCGCGFAGACGCGCEGIMPLAPPGMLPAAAGIMPPPPQQPPPAASAMPPPPTSAPPLGVSAAAAAAANRGSGQASQVDAVTSVLATSTTAKQVIPGRFYGYIKSYSGDKGFGFVHCAQTAPIFNRDIFVHRREFERAAGPVGAAVSFFVELNSEGSPQARGMQVLPEILGQSLGLVDAAAADDDAGSSVTGTGDVAASLAVAVGGGTSRATVAGAAATAEVQTRAQAQVGASLAANLRAGGPAADSVQAHLAKLFPLGMGGEKGVEEYTKAQAMQSDKMMAEFLTMQAKTLNGKDGEEMTSEELTEKQEEYSRYAAALQLQYAAAVAQCTDAAPEDGAAAAGSGRGKPWQNGVEVDDAGRPRTKVGAYIRHDPGQRYCGHITKWLDEEGFGFVRCPESQKVYGKDIFLHKAQIGQEADLYKQRTKMTISNGNKVSFTVEIQRGMPRAKDVVLEDLKDIQPVEKEHLNLYEDRGRSRRGDRDDSSHDRSDRRSPARERNERRSRERDRDRDRDRDRERRSRDREPGERKRPRH